MWDERYGSDEFVYGTEPNGFLKDNVRHLPPGQILCLAEGEGRNAVFLAEHGYRVTGIDASRVGLEKARKLALTRSVSIDTIVGDLAAFPIVPRSWEGIVSIFCHLPKAIRRGVHARVVQGLKPGGVFMLEAYTPRQPDFGTGGPASADLLVSLADLLGELHGLTFEHALETEREVIEGRLHTGKAAVVQIIARKTFD